MSRRKIPSRAAKNLYVEKKRGNAVGCSGWITTPKIIKLRTKGQKFMWCILMIFVVVLSLEATVQNSVILNCAVVL